MSFLFLANTVLAARAVLITPAELNEQLAQPAVASYQQTIRSIPQQTEYPVLLNRLPHDPAVPNAAREWLLYQAAIALRAQRRSAVAEQWLQSLQNYPEQTQIAEDLEGRQRLVTLAPVATAVRATLRWWQQQQHAEAIQAHIDAESVMAAAGRWSVMEESDRAAWLLASKTSAPDWSARLAGLNRPVLAKQAPALAANLALATGDADLTAEVLSSDDSEAASQLLVQVPQVFPAEELRLYSAARNNPVLRSQSWFQLAKSADIRAQQQLRASAMAGDRSAVAAWLQQQGDKALPELRSWLLSADEKQQLNAVFALKVLATPDAQQLLLNAQKLPALSPRVLRELKP